VDYWMSTLATTQSSADFGRTIATLQSRIKKELRGRISTT